MYQIGDKIVYPMHGAGVIESIEKRTVSGEVRPYYVLHMPFGDTKLMIPTQCSQDIGIRGIISEPDCDRVFCVLSGKCSDMNANWSKRYRENMLKIKTGDIYEVADVFKSLTLRDRERGLSTGERKMLMNTRQILISELVLALNLDTASIEKRIWASLQIEA